MHGAMPPSPSFSLPFIKTVLRSLSEFLFTSASQVLKSTLSLFKLDFSEVVHPAPTLPKFGSAPSVLTRRFALLADVSKLPNPFSYSDPACDNIKPDQFIIDNFNQFFATQGKVALSPWYHPQNYLYLYEMQLEVQYNVNEFFLLYALARRWERYDDYFNYSSDPVYSFKQAVVHWAEFPATFKKVPLVPIDYVLEDINGPFAMWPKRFPGAVKPGWMINKNQADMARNLKFFVDSYCVRTEHLPLALTDPVPVRGVVPERAWSYTFDNGFLLKPLPQDRAKAEDIPDEPNIQQGILEDWSTYFDFITSVFDKDGILGEQRIQARMKNFNTAYTTFSKLCPHVAWIPASLLATLDMVGSSMFGFAPSFSLKPKLQKEIVSLLNEVTKLESSVSISKDTADMVFRIEDLSRRFAVASSQLHLLDPGDTRGMHFRAAHKRFCELAVSARAKHASTTPRCPPLCIYLPGPPGIGKTQIAQTLAQELSLPLRAGDAPLLRNNQVYTMDFSANFQDGLTNQATIIADEWNTYNDPQLRLQGISWLLSAVNSTQVVIEKARADEKGLYYFNAELIFLTSNGQLSSLEKLVADPEAISRRISYTLDITPPDLIDGIFPQTPDGRIDFSKFIFTVTPFQGESQELTFQEMFELFSRRIIRDREMFNAALDNNNGFRSQVDRAPLADLRYVPVGHVHEPIGNIAEPAPYVAQGLFSNPFWSPSEENQRKIVARTHRYSALVDSNRFCTHSEYLLWLSNAAHRGLRIGLPYMFDGPPDEFVTWQAYMFALGHSTLPICSKNASSSDLDYLDMITELKEMPALQTEDRPNPCLRVYEVTKLYARKFTRFIASFVPSPFSFAKSCIQYLGLQMDTVWKYLKLACGIVVGGFLAFGAYKLYTAASNTIQKFIWPASYEERKAFAQGMVGSGNARRTALEKHRRNRRSANGDGKFISYEDFSTADYHPARSHKDSSFSEERKYQRARGGKVRGGTLYRPQSTAVDLTKTISRNTLFIETPFDVSYRAISPGGRYVIMPHHYLATLMDAGPCTLRSDSGSVSIDFSSTQVYIRPDMDMCAFLAPKQLPSFPEISHRFINDDDVSYVHDSFVHFLKKEDGTVATVTISETVVPTTQTWMTSESSSLDDAYVSTVFSFRHATFAGDCGSLYASHRGSLGSRNFIGYHVSGNGRNAQCTILTQEDIQAVYDAFEGVYDVPNLTQGFVSMVKGTSSPEVPEEIDPMFKQKEFTPEQLDKVFPTYPAHARILSIDEPLLHISRKSRLAPGPFHGVIAPPTTFPATLTSSQDHLGRDPLLEAYKRQTVIPLDIDDVSPKVLFESAVSTLTYVPKYQNGLTRTLTPHEAVLGMHALSPMKLNASAGEPYNSLAIKMGKQASKASWIQIPQANMVDFHPKILEDLDSVMGLLKNGIVPFWYVTDQLKDETVALTKIDACKTRLYFTADILHVLVARMLFGALISALEDGRLKAVGLSSCAVGMSTEDVAVRAMFREMNDPDKQIYAMDQKGFDNHQKWAVGKYLARAINAWYGESDELSLARYTFLKSCYHCVHRVGTVLYQVEDGMPSGISITAQLNSLYLETVTTASIHLWSKTRKSADGESLPSLSIKRIKDLTFAFYYGDDSWISLPKHLGIKSVDFFRFYTKFGLEATHCVKDFDVMSEIPVHLTSFLKRIPVMNESNELVFRKDLDDIHDIFSWIKKKFSGNWEVINSITKSALFEYRKFGIPTFEKYLLVIIDAYSSYGVSFTMSRNHRDYLVI